MRFRKPKQVLFLQHGEAGRAGLLGDVLGERGIQMTSVRTDLGESIPETMSGFDGLALGGGKQGVYETDRYPYLRDEMSLIRTSINEGRPVLGLCLGGQLIAASLGAEVWPADSPELGFYPVQLNEVAEYDPLLGGLNRSIQAAHWHSDIFEVPVGGMALASSDLTPHQLFRYGSSSYAFQFHLEMTLELMDDILERSRPILQRTGKEPDVIREQARQMLPTMQETAHTIFTRWTQFL